MKLPKVNKNSLVAVCVPCRDTIHSLFAYNLIKMMQSCEAVGIRTDVIMENGSLISRQRQRLAEAALASPATHILWLDSDMMFPVNIAETLISHDLDIVACNYSTRNMPLKGVAYTKMGDWDSWIGYNMLGQRMMEVEGVGMGCMLTKVDVFKNIPKPWFEVSWNDGLNDHIGEDFYFCGKLREHGFKVIVDTHLSRDISHLGTSRFDLSRTTR